jgi:succinate-acetate transporter protein
MGVLCFIYMICALRTNVVFVLIFAFLVPAFGLLTAAYWNLAKGNTAVVANLEVAAGACTFIVCCCGWWIFSAIMLASLDFPFQLPGMSSAPCCLHVLHMVNC